MNPPDGGMAAPPAVLWIVEPAFTIAVQKMDHGCFRMSPNSSSNHLRISSTGEPVHFHRHGILSALTALAVYICGVLPFLMAIHFQFTHKLIAARGPDPRQWLWFFRWWPYAIVHGLNPLYSHVIWAPNGENLTWATSTPALAVALAPITLIWGAIATYNVVALSGPVLAAWCTYLLCREITGKFWPALAGGWIFGFSAFELAELMGRPNLYTTWPLPILALLALLRFRRKLGRSAFLAGTALVLILLFGISVEVLASAVIFGLLTLATAVLVVPSSQRRAVITLVIESMVAMALCGLVVSPYLWFMLTDPHCPHGNLFPPEQFATDLANIILPTPTAWFGGPRFENISEWFSGVLWEQDAYIGLPLLIMIVLYYREFYKTTAGKVIMIGGGAALLFSMGPHLQLFNKSLLIPMPWRLWEHLPLLKNIWPGRLTVYTFLALGVMAAMWLAESKFRGSTRFLLAFFTLLFIFPNYAGGYWTVTPENPAFFSRGLYKHYLRRGENVIILPYGLSGYAIPWQAETNFYFNLAGGWLGQAEGIAPYSDMSIPRDLHRRWGGANYPEKLAAFIRRHQVGALLVEQRQIADFAALLKPIHIPPLSIGGMRLYQFDRYRLRVRNRVLELARHIKQVNAHASQNHE